ncbi:hypothetical protein Cob_v009528 [Colletotrichum orbiculare MAFF 240422]|uniref:alpha-L-rhamnosidase n=1 Tax=Colletotrichum orbiculare (strain 104-T / ATCC 96160 / CBS 514.97 / LARS 414 / MAFF 240422) TaxID=1213857 RepID=A0A484FII9_COLOR|nr:hypothetical protein Cob_v009528 [Colletotrichum orbiculare MAFF 240422]
MGYNLSASYEGKALKSRVRYYWRLRTWDQGDELGDEDWQRSASSWFEIGLLRADDWKATWISTPGTGHPTDDRTIYLYRKIHLDDIPASARAYVTACGWYKLFVNGSNITGTALVPRWTPFDHFTEYQAYDLTGAFKSGDNIVSIVVAEGRFRGELGITEGRARYGQRLAALAQIEVHSPTGEDLIFATDPSWKSASGHILTSDPKLGERVDLRIPDDCWKFGTETIQQPVTDKTVEIVKVATKALIAEEVPRLEEVMRINCQSVQRPPSGQQILDFGQNFTGVIRIQLNGKQGTEVTLIYSEVLNSKGEINVAYLLPPPVMDKPQRDVVILRDGKNEFQPWLTIFGFRYVEVKGLDHNLKPSDVEGIVLASNLEQTSTFECSDSRLNKLYQNIVWAARGNFTDTPTDCPTRERMGWTGDIQVFSPTAALLFNNQAFLGRYMRCLAAEQYPTGEVPPYIPSGASEFRGGPKWTTKIVAQSTGWGDASVIVPWNLYQHYADKEVLEQQYASMKLWVDSLERRARDNQSWRRWLFGGVGDLEKYILDTGFHWGEWLRAGEPFLDSLLKLAFPSAAVATAYLAHSSRLLAQISAILGKSEEEKHYHGLSNETRRAWRAAFVRNGGRRIAEDFQDDYIRALAFDLLEEDQKPAAVERVVELIEKAGWHLTTGFMSTGLLLPTLAANGRSDVAYKLLLQNTMPSWLYPVELGATTLWETWNGYDSKGNPKWSHNHYAFGSVAQWLIEGVAGIRRASPGYRRLRFEPRIGEGLTYASSSLDTPFGVAKISWKVGATGDLTVSVTVPPGATAVVVLGNTREEDVGSGTYTFKHHVLQVAR